MLIVSMRIAEEMLTSMSNYTQFHMYKTEVDNSKKVHLRDKPFTYTSSNKNFLRRPDLVTTDLRNHISAHR